MINDKPGPELDERISVFLFNVAVTDYYSQVGPYAIASNEAAKSYYMDYPDGPEIPVVPEYSTTWNGMQLVVEEMQRRGWKLVMSDEGDQWNAFFYWDQNRPTVECYEQSAPHAVCMASLKALEDDKSADT